MIPFLFSMIVYVLLVSVLSVMINEIFPLLQMFGHSITGTHRARLLSAAYSDDGAARNHDPSSLDKVGAALFNVACYC